MEDDFPTGKGKVRGEHYRVHKKFCYLLQNMCAQMSDVYTVVYMDKADACPHRYTCTSKHTHWGRGESERNRERVREILKY